MQGGTYRLAGLAAALWWGSLTSLFVFVPLLFANLPTPALAGNTAAKLFTAQTWIAIGCTLLLIVLSRAEQAAAQRVRDSLALILLGLLLALLVEYAVAPHILARDNLRWWHSVGSAMLLLQWICAGAVLWRLLRPSAR